MAITGLIDGSAPLGQIVAVIFSVGQITIFECVGDLR